MNTKAEKKAVKNVVEHLTDETVYECESTCFKMFESNLHGKLTIKGIAE